MASNNDRKKFLGDFSADIPLEEFIETLYSEVSQQIPVDLIVLWTYSTQSGKLDLYAFLTDQGLMFRADRMTFTRAGAEEFNAIMPEPFHLFRDSTQSPAIQEIMEEFPVPQPFTVVTLHSHIKEDLYSVASVCSYGSDNYGERELQIIRRNYDKFVANLRYVQSSVELQRMKERTTHERQTLLRRLGYVGSEILVGEDSGLKDVMTITRRIAPLNTTVLITGETGVGKEVIASAIHNNSKRASKPLVSVNCGAIPESLLDSELFGHEKGAFTGARQTHQGYFEQAHEGTVFLDEIGELSLSAQVRLLRLLQSKKYQRVGGAKEISVDVRVIAATNRDLKDMVEKNLFRRDLWFRINTFPIRVPPLRERKEDIPSLALYFSRTKGKEMALPWAGSFAENAMTQLQAYSWPGNVRELQSVIERNLILSQGRPMSFPSLMNDGYSCTEEDGSKGKETVQDEGGQGFMPLDEAMRRHIKNALEVSGGRIEGIGGAAELLEINSSTLRARMKKLGIVCKRTVV